MAQSVATEAMTWVEGGRFRMGSDVHYPEEAPAHDVIVSGFWIDTTPVTNRQFAEFVKATGHVTLSEQVPDARDYPGALPEMLVAASMVFQPTAGPVRLDDWSQWWAWTAGANWRHPTGPDSTLDDLWDHPVVHVAASDAEAYAAWAGKALPTEAEWERAARGHAQASEFAWGDALEPGGRHMANIWQGPFPHANSRADGWVRTSPVGHYPANDFGIYDMIGNVWEWTADWYAPRHAVDPLKPCCVPENPRGAAVDTSFDPAQPAILIPRRVLKGGSHLCAPSYCRRYRPAARHAQTIDTGMSHLGFRCVRRPEPA
jgi:formylglycine-generating enzyme required for sulfatase activity